MEDLEASLRDEIDLMFIKSKSLLEAGDKIEAIRIAESAWRKLPDPKFSWDVSKSFAHALAETFRDAGVHDKALSVMNELFTSGTVMPHQDRPAFVLGTIYYEMGDMENARRWLSEANRISKGRCFRDEPEKYRKAIAK